MELIKNDNLWFGNYGGCFIADAFSLHCDHYYKQFKELIESEEFQKEFETLKNEYLPKFQLLDDHTVLIPENYYSVLGEALIHKDLFKKQALVGCRYVDEALFVAKICNKLGIRTKMYVTKELSGIKTLMSELKMLGIEVVTKNCIEYINHPEMYTFQEWLSEEEEKHIINSRCNTGAFPQVNVASYFVKQFKKDFDEFLKQNNVHVKKVAVPVISGTSAIGLIGDDLEYVTYECDDEENMFEELDSFCGTFTKVRRNNTTDRVLCPQLCQMWDENKVIRKIVSMSDLCPKKNTYGTDLSLQSLAVLNNEEDKDTLRVVKALRIGTNL